MWCEFATHTPGCIVLPWTDDKWVEKVKLPGEEFVNPKLLRDWVTKRAKEITGEEPTKIYSLPYDASPVLNREVKTMTLCYSPTICKGHSSCPKRPACSE